MAENEGEEETPKKGSGKTMMIMVALLILGAGGGGGAFFMISGKRKAEAAHEEKAVPEIKIGPTLSIPNIIVNLNEPGGTRYLKVTLDLELLRALVPEEEGLMVRLRDRLLIYLAGLQIAQTQKPESKQKIKDEVVKLANEVYGDKTVRNVYFKEFVIQ